MTTEPTDKEIEAAARALCVLAGHEPDAPGEPPGDPTMAVIHHAAPRWRSWRKEARAALTAAAQVRGEGWQPIETAPKQSDKFILLYCPEDKSRWLASWQGGEWYGVDNYGLTRSAGHSLGDPDYVTGWFLSHWRPLPAPPTTTGE